MKTVIEVLTEARELVKRGWCQSAIAVDKFGSRVTADHETACAWSAVGATWAAARKLAPRDFRAERLLELTAKEGGFEHHAVFNDAPGRTQAEVVALFDRAIERAKEAA